MSYREHIENAKQLAGSCEAILHKLVKRDHVEYHELVKVRDGYRDARRFYIERGGEQRWQDKISGIAGTTYPPDSGIVVKAKGYVRNQDGDWVPLGGLNRSDLDVAMDKVVRSCHWALIYVARLANRAEAEIFKAAIADSEGAQQWKGVWVDLGANLGNPSPVSSPRTPASTDLHPTAAAIIKVIRDGQPVTSNEIAVKLRGTLHEVSEEHVRRTLSAKFQQDHDIYNNKDGQGYRIRL